MNLRYTLKQIEENYQLFLNSEPSERRKFLECQDLLIKGIGYRHEKITKKYFKKPDGIFTVKDFLEVLILTENEKRPYNYVCDFFSEDGLKKGIVVRKSFETFFLKEKERVERIFKKHKENIKKQIEKERENAILYEYKIKVKKYSQEQLSKELRLLETKLLEKEGYIKRCQKELLKSDHSGINRLNAMIGTAKSHIVKIQLKNKYISKKIKKQKISFKMNSRAFLAINNNKINNL